MDNLEILRELTLYNPWWNTGEISLDESLVKRDIFPDFLDLMDDRTILGIVGIRRVGKTTLLKQAIKHLLKTVPQERILYFSLDMFKLEEQIIKQIFDIYFRNILHEVPAEAQRVYIFIDEIQKVPNWGNVIKSIYDMGYSVKFIVSGSSSMNILRGSGESLVGRIYIMKLFPFSFHEFMKYNGMETDIMAYEEPSFPFEAEKIIIMFNRFILSGGFPELYLINSEEKAKIMLKTNLDLTFYRDIINLFDVKRVDVLEGIFYSILKQSGNVVKYNTLTTALGAKYETVKTYIEYLCSSFFMTKSHLYSSNTLKSFKKNPKIYVADHSFFNLSDTDEGLKIETIVFSHLIKQGLDVYYWQGKNKLEVDLVVKTHDGIIPIEVKYRKKIKSADHKGLNEFMESFDIKKGYVLTDEYFATKEIDGKVISYIPVWMFLLSSIKA